MHRVRSSYVLRLNTRELAGGILFGEVEEVATGRQAAVRSVEDLLDFCKKTASAAQGFVARSDNPAASRGGRPTEDHR